MFAVELDVVARLKVETQALHEEVERVVRIGAPEAGPDVYRWYLEKLFGFHRPVEERLGTRALPYAFDARRKAPLLEADLLALGVAPGQLPDCEVLPLIDSVSSALGVAYVLEGASLGGKVLQRAWAQRVPAEAMHYLGVYGDQVGDRWREFREVIRQQVPVHEVAACVEGAQATFTTLIRWFREG